MSEVAIKLTNVSKRFKLYHDIVSGPVKEMLFFWKSKHYYQEFKAVRNVNLEIRKGEVIGIIGPNGAGKTTLLKMIAGLLPVDGGTMEVNGKVTALLALGVGVNPEFTGRENIFYSGMLLGMSKAEVLSKMEDIIEFSELGDYIDRPFRTYSSGMKARVLFATSMGLNPDILVVDEALATGDSYFVQKSSERIQMLCKSGATILFVSHNLEYIQKLCERTFVMHNGALIYEGNSFDAVNKYIETVYKEHAEKIKQANKKKSMSTSFRGTGEIYLEDIYFTVEGQRTETLRIGKSCELHVEFEALHDIEKVILLIEIRSDKSPIRYAYISNRINYFIDDDQNDNVFSLKKGKGKYIFTFSPLILGDGNYRCDLEFYSGEKDYIFSYDTCFCYYPGILRFQAVYRNSRLFGRRTITEIPVRSVSVEKR